jgi:hypothetical protein
MTHHARSSRRISVACLALILAGGIVTHAGGALETFDITGARPSPFPGQLLARVIGMKWDARTIPVKYSLNTTLDPIPNPLGPAFLTIAAAGPELQASFNAWNSVRTSFIDMRITGTTANPGLRGFDMVNEITFRTAATFAAIASSPSVTLIEDATFVHGDLIDNDADPDVSSAISVATDVDGDGDLEFPAGFYKAGTILDNDVQFNTKTTNGFRFTIAPADADIVTRSTDLPAVAIHEFGHSHGLSHAMNNQTSDTDATGATMFPFIDTGDPVAELSARTLDVDDIAYSSFYYREGSANTGPAALQAGDVAFSKEFGTITGELRKGVTGEPIAGGNVYTIDRDGATGVGAFSGTVELSFNPANGGLFVIPDQASSILDGNYVIPVLKGRYSLAIEPVDGTPVPSTSVSFTTQIGDIFGQQTFNEEPAPLVHRGNEEVSVNAGKTKSGFDIETSDDINIDNFGSRDFNGFTAAPPGRIYAVRIPAAQIADAGTGRLLRLKAIAFHTGVTDASVAPVFAEALLTTGRVNADGTIQSIDLSHPLVRDRTFIGQDDDLEPLFVKHGVLLGQIIELGVRFGLIDNLFLVLRVPTPPPPFPGISARPPLIGLDGGVPTNDAPIFGFSYISDDGGATYTQRTDFNFRFSLRFSDLAWGGDD